MPYAIQLPDGTLVENIPDDLDPIEAKARISAHFKLSEPVKKNTSGIGDIGTAAKQAFVGAAKSATDVFGADNEYSEKLAGVQQRLEQEYTPERALERQKREQLQEEAAKSGDTLKEISTYLGGVTEAPVQALASGVASVAPYAALALGAKVVGLPVGIVLSVFGAAQSAGAVKGGIYETIKKELEKTGVDSEKAKEKAIKAQEYFGDNFGNIAAAGGIGAVAGRKGIEGLLVPGALAKQQANIVPRVATSMLKEAPIEGLQGGQQQFAENVALQQEGFDIPTFQGVAGSAARDAAIGALTAAPIGAIARPPKVDLEATYTNVIDELRNTLGTSETLEPQEVLKQIQQISQLQDPAQIQALYETALNNGDFNTVPMPDNSIRIQIPEASTQQKVEEAVEDSTPDAFTPELRQSIESFKQPIIKQMQRFGLSNVGLKIFDTIENGRADGYYANKVIALAMDSPSPLGTLRHETVHALRELGGFKPNEWNVLSKKAKNEWTDQFIKNVKVGDGTLYDQYQAQYQKDNNGSLDGFDDYITEEAVAEAFRYFDVNGAPSGLVGNLYYRLKQFFETLRNGFTGAGFDTTDKIFTRVEQGKAAPTIENVAEQPNKYALKGSMPHYKNYENLANVFETAGLKIKESGSSKSGSKYVEIIDPVSGEMLTVRFANHPQTSSAISLHGPADIEIGNIFKIKSWEEAVNPILEKINKNRKKYGDELLTLELKKAKQPTKYAFKQTPAPEDVPQDIWDLYSKYERITKMANEKIPSELNAKGVYPRPQDLKREETLSFRRLNDAISNYFGAEWDGSPSGPIYDMHVRLNEEMGNRDLAQEETEEVTPKKYSIKNVPPLQEAFDYARSKDFKTNRELKVDLQSLTLKELDRKNINIKEFNKKAVEYLTEIGNLDAEYALKSNPNAVGWYDITVAKALNIVALLHPEILTNPDAKFAFTWALAVTSNGIKVDKNFELAEQAYRGYKENGVMPTNIEAGQAQIPINIGLGMFNQMVNKYGIDDMRKFMATEFTVSQLKKITNLDLAGENADTKVLGSFILGAKIGNGFFSNLNGIFDKLTMDRWLMRTWGRWTGTLITERPDKVKEYIGINRRNIAGLKTNPELREAVEAITKTNITVDSLEDILKDNESVQNFAVNLAKYWSKEDLRNIIDSAPKGEALRLSTNTLLKYIDGQKEKPDSGTERNEIREIFSNILERLNKKGYKDLSMADLQAALWYSERRLYDAAKESNVLENYADDEAPDYANAAAGLVIKNGISKEAVDKVILDTKEQYADRATGIQRDAGEISSKVSLQGRVQGFAGKELKHFLARGVLQSYRELNEETPDTFKRNSGKDGKGFRVLKHHAKTKFSPELKFANSLKTIGVTTPTFYEMDAEAAPTFQKLIQESKDNNAFGAAVTVYPVEAYEDMRLFFTEDGKAGFALKGNDIVSVFSQDPYVGGVNGIIRLAVQEGGRKLDAFDTVLPDLYFNNGFQVTSRMKWNDDYVPDGWNKETFKSFNNGEPDVVFMAYQPSNNKRPTNQTGKLVDDYDEAVNIQEEVVKVAPKYSLSTKQGLINEQNKRFAFALQNNLTPDTFLTSDRNKNINGNLAFMPQNSPFPKLPIRMAIGIQDDVQNRGSGATHILRRIQQEYDKAHMPEPLTKDLLEDLLRRAENVGESFGFVYRSGNNLVLHDALSKVSIFVNKQPDHFSINSMYKDPEAFRKYGNPVWRGRNEQPMRGFQEKVTEDFRAVPVVAGERGVELKNKPTAPTIGIKKRRVVSPDEIAKMSAPAGAKLAIRAPQTETFKRWFGNSKVVDKDGNPLIVYHSTTNFQGNEFKISPKVNRTGNPDGYYFTHDLEDANEYAGNEEGSQIIPVYLSIKKPYNYSGKSKHTPVMVEQFKKELAKEFDLDRLGDSWVKEKLSAFKEGRFPNISFPTDAMTRIIEAGGYDGMIDGRDWVAFNSNQIKSATGNKGTFDATNPDIRYAIRASQTETFKRWFGNSKVVDKDGNPLIVYHGTTKDFNAFDEKYKELGFHFGATPEQSNDIVQDNKEFSKGRKNVYQENARIIPAFLKINKPFETLEDIGIWDNVDLWKNYLRNWELDGGVLNLTEKQIENLKTSEDIVKMLKRKGYDGIEYPNHHEAIEDDNYMTGDFPTAYIVFEPSQIKSATGNKGTFDATNPDIRYQIRAPETKEFKQFFKDSKVVDNDGNPLVMYHGTYDDFTVPKINFGDNEYYQFGFHVGNSEQASKRIADLNSPDNFSSIKNKSPNIMPFYVQAKNPLRLDENRTGRWGIDDIMKAVIEKAESQGIDGITQEMINDYYNDQFDIEEITGATEVGSDNYDPDKQERFWADDYGWKSGEKSSYLKTFLEQLGYDSIVYANEYEGGGDSYILLSPNQVKSAFNQKPTKSKDIRYQIRAPNTPEFKRFFGSSKIVNEDGTPKVMYHGTARDISEFRPKQANAIFLTEIPEFAESFSDSSEDYLIREFIENATPEQTSKIITRAIKQGLKEKDITPSAVKNIQQMTLQQASLTSGIGYLIRGYVKESLPTGQNILPVFVKAENPFDYENPRHINRMSMIFGEDEAMMEELANGNWNTIESEDVQENLRDMGYDGFYVKEGGVKNLAVYNSNQIKSATGNVGTFDIGTPDIRYSLNRLTTLQNNKTAGQKISQAYDTAKSNFGNSQYWIAKRNGWIDPSSGLAISLQKLPVFNLDGELRADMLVRAKSQALNLIKNGLLSGIPVLNADGTIGIQRSENNFARSMYLADQLDKNTTVKASGLSGRGYVAEVARILRGADILKEDARLNAEGVRQLDEAKIAMKEAKDLFKQGKMKEARKKEKEAKKLQKEGIDNKKSNRELQVTPAHIKWAEQQLAKVPEMNEILGIWKTVNNGLVDLWEEVGLLSKSKADEYRGKDNYIPLFKSQEDLGDAEFFAFPGGGLKSTKGFKQLKGSTAIRNIWENLDKHYAVMLSHAYENQTRRVAVNQLKTFQLAENLNANDPDANLWYKEDGKKVGARIENLNDLAAFQMMTYELGPLMQFFAGSTQLLRAGALINPMYWIKQLIRDPIHANLVAGSGIITPLHSMRGFVEVLMKNSRESKILTDRGVLGSVDSTTTINQFLEQFGKEKASPTILTKALSKIMSIHEASDAATRVEIYKKAEAKALKEGKTADQAMSYAVHMARESINFSVHGNSPALNALRHSIPFFSAAINSLDTVYRAATGFGLNAKEKKEAQVMFISRAVMMVMLSTMYAMLYQDDEEYKKLPDYVKDNHWLIPNPMSEKPPFIKIPTPFEIGFLFKTIPEALVRYMAGTSTGKEVLASYGAGLLHNLPANGLPVPQAIKPVAENFINFSFFTGRGIEGMSDQGRPVAERGQRASEFAKILSSYGLDKIGQSPAKIDNLIQGYFAELGTFSTGLASSLLFLAQGKEPPSKNIENMPFMKAFLTDRNVVKAISDFYELDHNAKEVATQFNDLKQSGMTEDIQKLIDDPEKKAQLMASPVFRKVSTQMATIRKAIKYYKDNQDSGSADFRRDKINELTEILGRVAESGYKIAEATGVSR